MISKEVKYLSAFETCDYFIDLGIHIAYYRKRVGLKQQELADRLHIDRTYLSRIESPNQNQHLSFELFFNICMILDIPPQCFFEPFPKPGSKKYRSRK